MNEEIILNEGIEIDIQEGWKKIAARQFGGNPGRAALELIQNMIDSYDESVPFEKRKGAITTDQEKRYLSVSDWGSGFTEEKIRLILTLGGTDKLNDRSKIGRFGIGFFSIFSQALKTQKVVLTTCCEGSTVQVCFTLPSPGALPVLEMKILESPVAFSTRIEVFFGCSESVSNCLSAIQEAMRYYPCPISINGIKLSTVWDEAEKSGAQIFQRTYCKGFLSDRHRGWVNILSKYEHVIGLSINSLLCGAQKPTFTLEDFRVNSFPYMSRQEILINCDSLNLTISRDSFYLDYEYTRVINDLREEMLIQLGRQITRDKNIALANLFVFQRHMGVYVQTGKHETGSSEPMKRIVEQLYTLPLFHIAGSENEYSIEELKGMLRPGRPLFYSPNQENVYWLGRRFVHDFILIPKRCYDDKGTPRFYNQMIQTIFHDVVNLDEIQGNNTLIQKLVERGIVDERLLNLNVRFLGKRINSREENQFLEEINLLLHEPSIIRTIEENIFLRIRKLNILFFTIENKGAYISTGLFDEDQLPLTDRFWTNFKRNDANEDALPEIRQDLLLGIRKDHPLIRQLIHSENPHRAYFALTYLAHELTYCQKLLVPHSLFYHITREKLSRDMREAMMNVLLGRLNRK